jgi:hypothetical protein
MGIDQFQTVSIRAIVPTFFAVVLSCLTSIAYAQTSNSYPMLMSLKPTAAQIGQATEHELSARYNLAGASQVLVTGLGVVGEVLPNDQEKPEDRTKNDVQASKCKLRFTVAADAIPGVRDFRVMTPHGVSTLGQLVIARDPIVVENPDNDTKDKAQLMVIPSTFCGTIEKAEDVDWVRFHVDAGTNLTFHVRSMRLLDRIHDMQTRIDPMITIRTAEGATVAAGDNYYAGDPLLNHTFAEGGDYFLEVRDVRYQGNIDWVYAIEIHSRPFVTQVYPPAAIQGQASQVAAIGFHLSPGTPLPLPDVASVALATQSTTIGSIVSVASSADGLATNEFAVLSLKPDMLLIQETVQDPAAKVGTDGVIVQDTSRSLAATPMSVPSTVVGCIREPGEIDRFVFEAKAQEHITFEVFARRLQSGIDPKIRIADEQGGLLSEGDDATFKRVISADSWLENWTSPADGKYLLEIQDLHQRGGPSFTYAIQATRAEPSFLLEVDTDKTLLSPGMGGVIYVRALRKNGFAGEIQIEVSGLPSGVMAQAGKIPPEITDGIVYLNAATDAPKGATNIHITGKATHVVAGQEPVLLTTVGSVLQEYYAPGGGRGNYPVVMHTISVAEPGDIRRIKLSKSDVALKPGESQRIDIEIERAADFKGNVTLDMIYQHLEQPYGNSLPRGVTVDYANSKTLLTASDTSGHITLKAAADAPAVAQQLVPVNVHVTINFVMKHTFCESPIRVSVER